jgi:hypothetical protein
VLRDVAADTFVQERQARDAEIELHRALAGELIDIGYRALATRLHRRSGRANRKDLVVGKDTIATWAEDAAEREAAARDGCP